ncbi:hypothetical protein [Streptomyces sp. URMC 123]|uniref:hypothetical protein n=1 Tax=Streptomyces sp. URMC 123 TaxID=3423403 RepID=UPI003F1A7452
MSQEAVPGQALSDPSGEDGAASGQAAPDSSAPQQGMPEQQTGAPKGLLQQMEELMAALNADLSQLDADLQSSAGAPPRPAGSAAPDEERTGRG